MTVRALVAHPDGSRTVSGTVSGDAAQAGDLGRALADQLIEGGAANLLRAIEADIG